MKEYKCGLTEFQMAVHVSLIWNGYVTFGLLFKVAREFSVSNSIGMHTSCPKQWGTLAKFIYKIFKIEENFICNIRASSLIAAPWISCDL